jgi:multidrug resistance efflux pump
MNASLRSDASSRFLSALRQLQKVRAFQGHPQQYWSMLLEAFIMLSDAAAGIICARFGDDDKSEWKILAGGPQDPASLAICKQLSEAVGLASEQCAKKGCACLGGDGFIIIAVNLLVDVDTQKCCALFRIETTDEREATARISALLAVNDVPAEYRIQQSAFDAVKNQSNLSGILDIMTLINAQHRFVAAAMTVCNELAGRYACDRVSLGWKTRSYVRVKAMSHTDQFEKKMEVVQQLERAMEEALDQEADIVYPAADQDHSITRDHESYAKAQDAGHCASLPLRKNDEITAICTFERRKTPLSRAELRCLRIALDQVATRLVDLKKRDRWFGARWGSAVKEMLGHAVGYEHTWAKAIGLLSAAVVIVVAFIPVRYRVDSSMILRTDDIIYITAPFDGYIDSVAVKAGEEIGEGQSLLNLDKKDLLLEESSLLAERNRAQREAEKARAAGELADMCIAQAQYDQASAKLDITQNRLRQAAVTSPYDGVIIEGDQRERTGSPVKQGEVLFKVGRLKDIYAEAKVSENEVHHIALGACGQIALASRPQDFFGVTVRLLEPSAVVSQKDNVFLTRCAFTAPVPPWFRPGMTGVSKINAGRHTILWILSHRTIDFLRLKLWW